MADTLRNLHPLGLALRKTPSFLELIEEKLIQETNNNSTAEMNHKSGYCTTNMKVEDFVSQPVSEKLKASNFPASLLRIGIWERRSRYEGDLVAKCYYAKRKLVWEFLELGLKRKIELMWSDIIAIEVDIKENELGILKIELNQPPTFHEETDPQPRKHTIWKNTSDFTGGQATICRRHYLQFPQGALDRHYEKLLQCDNRLFELSQRPFPSLQSPSFPTNIYGFKDFSFNFNVAAPDLGGEMQFSFSNIRSPSIHCPQVHAYEPTTMSSSGFKDSASPISVVRFSNIDEHVSKHVLNNSRMAIWGHTMNNYANTLVRPQVRGITSNALVSLMNPAISCQNYNQPSYVEGTESLNSSNQALNDLQSHLFNDSQVPCSDEKYYLAKVESFGALINLPKEESLAGNITPKHENCELERIASDNEWLMSDVEHSSMYQQQEQQPPQPVSWMSLEAANENSMMPENNNFMYHPDPMLENCVVVNNDNGEYSW
ncbi:hypothetical protein CFOL_v3_30365, partial [Cephalotus follicularis]